MSSRSVFAIGLERMATRWLALEGQLPSILAQLLGLLAMHHMVQLGDEVLEAPDDLLEAGGRALDLRVLAPQRRNAATASRWSSGMAERSIRAGMGMAP